MAWCHECELFFDDESINCPACGGPLSEDTPPGCMEKAEPAWGFSERPLPWPEDRSGAAEQGTFLVHIKNSTGMEGELLVNRLQSCGIPTVIRYPGDGSFGRVVLGFSGFGMDIYVPASKLEEAQLLLEDREK